MSAMLPFQAFTRCSEILSRQGIEIEAVTDVDTVHRSVEEIGKPYLTPWLNPATNDFTPENYFWLIGRQEGTAVLVGGARLDIVQSNASGAFLRMFRRAYGPDAVLGVSSECDKLCGRLVYFGDLQSRTANGLSRKLVRYFLGLAHAMAVAHFRADVVYSFIRKADGLRGSADINGFDGMIRSPLLWGEQPPGRNTTERLYFRGPQMHRPYFEELLKDAKLELADNTPTTGPLQLHSERENQETHCSPLRVQHG